MATETTLLTISFLIDRDYEVALRTLLPLQADEQIRKAVLAALAAVLSGERPDVRVEWESMSVVPLEGKPAVGRCAVCNRWVDLPQEKWTRS
ncbi:hypothetical protein R5W24_006406 [Gemmata sp. JC717]|uniref:hypothetical protein n=1 Tax=Gemmata algarum TaxID=2975278 RepID=UPI0021BB39F3|nr:hypothetical protein [Gemmata algarum]MDY3557218.1 hypothetical protein [Gemmata algarum]